MNRRTFLQSLAAAVGLGALASGAEVGEPAVETSEWMHVAVVKDNSNVRIYQDGTLRFVGDGSCVTFDSRGVVIERTGEHLEHGTIVWEDGFGLWARGNRFELRSTNEGVTIALLEGAAHCGPDA